MANKKHNKNSYELGPYEGSEGRKIYVKKYKGKDGKWHTTSSNAARRNYEKSTGRTLPRDVDVDHKDNNKKNDSASNLHPMTHGANVAKENKRRAGTKKKKKK